MRLIGKVARLEAALAERGRELQADSICWSWREHRLDRPLLALEHLAVDVEIVSERDEGLPMVTRTSERASTVPGDWGVVRAGGEIVGRVVRVVDTLLVIDYSDEGVGKAAALAACDDDAGRLGRPRAEAAAPPTTAA
jgi:hypothetical protein